jgi:hypothetical protein
MFGRDHVVHVAIAPGRLAERLHLEADRLAGLRGQGLTAQGSAGQGLNGSELTGQGRNGPGETGQGPRDDGLREPQQDGRRAD